jgi:hypothetical protein
VNRLVAAVTAPSGAIVALTPLVVTTSTERSCSTARTRDMASCWKVMSVKPKVALLLGTASTCAPASTLSATRSSKAISQQIATPSRTPAASTAPTPPPGTKLPARSA